MTRENDQKASADDSLQKPANEAIRVGTDPEIRGTHQRKDEQQTPKPEKLRDGTR